MVEKEIVGLYGIRSELVKGTNIVLNRAWNHSTSFRMKIIRHMIRAYYRCCCINEPVIFSHCVYLKLGCPFHALLKVYSECDDIVHLTSSRRAYYIFSGALVQVYFAENSEKISSH